MPKYLVTALQSAETATDWESMSAEEIQRAMQRYLDWNEDLRARGKAVAGGALDDDGRVLRKGDDGVLVSDGPYTEAKEYLGGYAIIDAADYDEAVRLCRTHPHLDFGSIEIREINELE